MLIKEQLYAILPIEMLESIDWDKTYQSPDRVRKDINETLFIISKPEDSDYLPNVDWIGQSEAHDIASSDEFAGPRPNEV
jgi:hypothetical protein